MLELCLTLLDSDAEKADFTQIYDRYKRLVFYSAWEVLHEETLAEDVLQEVFLYIAQNFSKLPVQDGHKMARYLVLAGRTRALNLLEKRRRELPQEDAGADAAADAVQIPENAVVTAAQTQRLLELVAGLKEIYRAPLELLADGCTYAQIAALLNISEATARKRVERGRKLLWKELERDEKEQRGFL